MTQLKGNTNKQSVIVVAVAENVLCRFFKIIFIVSFAVCFIFYGIEQFNSTLKKKETKKRK